MNNEQLDKIVLAQTSTIAKSHPQLWSDLTLYKIDPTIQVLNDLREILELGKHVDPPDGEYSHEILMELLKNQVFRYQKRNAQYIKDNSLTKLVQLPKLIISDKPTPPPGWQKNVVKN